MNEYEFKIPFAYNEEGMIVDIETAEKHKDYYCSCGAVVHLRGGKKTRNHFYHLSETSCSSETVMHKAFKSVFQKIKSLGLPYPVNGETMLKFDKVELEHESELKFNDMLPDAVAYIGEKPYMIEFAYTHYIDEAKRKKIQMYKIPCIEIEIGEERTEKEIIEKLNGALNKEIIYMPEYYEMKKERKIYYEKLAKYERVYHNKMRSLELKEKELNNEKYNTVINNKKIVENTKQDIINKFDNEYNGWGKFIEEILYNGSAKFYFQCPTKYNSKMFTNYKIPLVVFSNDNSVTLKLSNDYKNGNKENNESKN